MTQKDKELLLKDLCARLNYGLRIQLTGSKTICSLLGIRYDEIYTNVDSEPFDVDFVKPYLRPMSSMTEEEEQIRIIYERDIMSQGFGAVRIYMSSYIDWLNSKHFDWRTDGDGKTLIKKGLALKAPENMYK